MGVMEFLDVFWNSFKQTLDNVGAANVVLKSIGYLILILLIVAIYIGISKFLSSIVPFAYDLIIFLISGAISTYLLLVIIRISYDVYKNKTIRGIVDYFISVFNEGETLKNMFIAQVVFMIVQIGIVFVASILAFGSAVLTLQVANSLEAILMAISASFLTLLIFLLIVTIVFPPIISGTFFYIALKKASFMEGLSKGIELFRNVGVWGSLLVSLIVVLIVLVILSLIPIIGLLILAALSLLLVASINAMFIHALKKIGVDV